MLANQGFGACTSFTAGEAVLDTELGDATLLDNVWAQIDCNSTDDTYYDKLITAYPNLKNVFTYFDAYLYDRESLTTLSLPRMQILGDYAAWSCQILSNVNLEKCLFIGSHGLGQVMYNSELMSGSIEYLKVPECRYFGHMAFGSGTNNYWCYTVGKVRADNLLYVGAECFYMCRSLSQIYAPNLKKVGHRGFWGCVSLVGSSYTENDVTIGTPNCVTLPECTHIGERGFSGRGSTMAVTKFDLAKCEHIGNGAFNNCSNLTDIYLYSMNGNTLVQAASSTSDTDASIGNWGLSTTTFVSTDASHNANHSAGVAVHCVNDAQEHIIVGYQNGAWRVIGPE